MARTFSLLLILGIALGGCSGASEYMAEAQRKAEEAKNILPENYKPDLLAFMRTYLNNPENLRGAALSQPQRIVLGDVDRYVLCMRFNGKDSAGKYAGSKDHLVVFISGKLDRLIELGRSDANPEQSDRQKPLRDYCAAAAYQAFPELERLRR